MQCGACGAEAPDGARFCGSCGHALGAHSDERRVATVVFADIVGFTGLAESRDPEHVKELVDRCFERLAADVTAFGGKVDKILGDALVALFGAPVAHGDDPERAVRAALRMQATVADQARREGASLQVRIGVNTGEVLAGAMRAGGEYTAMGDVVNTAQRLQASADPGTVVVGPATRAATAGVIAYRAVGPVPVRGREAPVEAFEALEPLLPPGYRPRRVGAPVVGRDLELGLLDGAVATGVRRRRAQLVLVVGEAGLGKSRLAAEVACRARGEHGAEVLEGRCLPYGEANPWWPLAEAVRGACGLGGDGGAFDARSAVADTVAELGLGPGHDDQDLDRVVEGLLHLLGEDAVLRGIDPQRAREETEWATLALFEAMARRAPVVLVLSDLHWAEDPVLDLVGAMLDRLGRCPFVLVATARTGLDERLAVRADARHNTLVVNLDPLEDAAALALVDALSERPLDDDLRVELVERAGGNPLFLEELLALVAESEGTSTSLGAGTSVGTDGLPTVGAAGLPETLRGLVAARIDGLSVRQRAVLADAAVWGHAGKVAVLEEMAVGHGDRTATAVAADLASLADRDILVVEGQQWSFRSELVREVAYGMLTKADRARHHAGIAWYLDRAHDDPGTAPDRVVDVVAHHYEAAAGIVGELGAVAGLPDGLVDRAVDWLEEASARAERSQLDASAVLRASQALALVLPSEDPAARARRAELLLRRARARGRLRQRGDAEADLAEATQLADAAGDERLVAVTALTRGDIEQKAGHLRASEASLREAVARFEGLGDVAAEADALRALGMTLIFAGETAAAEEAIAASLTRSRSLDDRRGEAWALQHLAWISFVATRADEAEERVAASAATFAELGDPGGLVWAEGLLAFVKFQQGRLDEAGELGERVGRLARQRGDRWGEGMMLALQAGVHLWSGRAAGALPAARDARRLFEAIGDRFGQAQASAVLGRALVLAGEVEAGLTVLDGVAALADDDESQVIRTMASNAIAAASVNLGDPERAAAALAAGPRASSSLPAVGDVERTVAEALVAIQRGDPETARHLLAPVLHGDGSTASAYAASTEALALAVGGAGPDEVEAAAEGAHGGGDGSHLDRFVASLAVVLSRCAHLGPDEVARLDALAEAADDVEDHVVAAIAALARAEVRRALALPGAERAEADAAERWAVLGRDGHGWRRALHLAVEPARQRTGA